MLVFHDMARSVPQWFPRAAIIFTIKHPFSVFRPHFIQISWKFDQAIKRLCVPWHVRTNRALKMI